MYPYPSPYGATPSILPALQGPPTGSCVPHSAPGGAPGVVLGPPTGAPAIPGAATAVAAPGAAGASAGGMSGAGVQSVMAMEGEEDGGDTWAVNRCHLHTKPQLHCKFCRKYKSFAQQLGILQKRELRQQEDDDVQKRNMVEMTDTTTFNVNALLRSNILASEYFKSLHELKTVPEVVEEIVQYAQHAEPYCSGSSRAPSTLFCCLYKLFTMKLANKQLEQLLDNYDSPYVRCTGFLYLRYVHPPEKLWKWFEPYFLDDEEFAASADPKRTTTIGEYVESLLTEDKYFNTVLPRLPVKVKNLYGTQVMAMDEHRKRKAHNMQDINRFVPGAAVQACSKGDWLEGEIISVDLESRPGGAWVQLEDGSEELIDLGLVILIESLKKESKKEKKSKKHKREVHYSREGHGSHRHSDDDERRRRSRSRSGSRGGDRERRRDKHASHRRHRDGEEREASGRSDRGDRHKGSKRHSRSGSPRARTQHDLLKEFRRKEREKALATGKDYARRPTSYKSSLSSRLTNAPHSQSSRTHVSSSARKSERSPSRGRGGSKRPVQSSEREGARAPASSASSEAAAAAAPKQPSQEHLKKVQQLMERYSRPGAGAAGGAPRTQDGDLPEVMRLGGR
ncbi:PRP38 family protein [Besnoitia besnoiti]|uniref:PRP38 family protein n=1 Tax=Besnoitia besnoiti TaxID=94643 RepID=A0A2A9M8L3_BESBE|nr:PRP38 family protein [Besnoitia besnoiti]PFH34818.1 PRP38 family protein [Besnoitia besnoiti]